MLDRIFSSKKVLFIGAHPDDIEFYCGGLVYMLRQRGIEVIFAIATKGGRGRSGNAKTRLENLRSAHQIDAANILGGAEVVMFDYPDKTLSQYIDLFADDLKKLIDKEKPDVIFSWDPDYIYNPHPDHIAAAKSGKIAGHNLNICYYGTIKSNLSVGYNEDVFLVKLRALKAHRTETPWYYFPIVKMTLRKRQCSQGNIIGFQYAESFRFEDKTLE